MEIPAKNHIFGKIYDLPKMSKKRQRTVAFLSWFALKVTATISHEHSKHVGSWV